METSNRLTEQEAVAALAALSNATRLRLFRLLVRAGHDGLNVGELQRLLEQPASTLAHHLSKLTSAGLVQQNRLGREVVCTAGYARMDNLLAYLTEQCCSGASAAQ
ncbi:ArsR/SmtB family transcription factor [Azoarcus taiwanensis]|uniref:Metalloregulator ArsR/SmtB family transcription factor n=1 Tax=Azoarcus taiwanensis TaxID=666964 RepID=A0A972FGS8_9RHOO|nr:metalloregulator ArsR/SmtB family transcription factor [Azoarcus taiwanensis]NMG02056.1 metalloregulator ArsR/SmtB family transcription factor [Azoarcus taiwanensis]